MDGRLPEDLLDGVEGNDRADREGLLRWLIERGVTPVELRQAIEEDRLALLPTEHLLTGGCTLSITEAAAQSGLRGDFIERVWRVAGISVPEAEEPVIDDEQDLEVMRLAKLALDSGMSEDAYVEISRVVGRAAQAIAQTMLEQTAQTFIEAGGGEADYAMRIEEFAEIVMPVMPALVAFPIRMHLRDTLRHQAIERTPRGVQGLKGTRQMAVGFADLVGFSALSQGVALTESSRLAATLEELAGAVARPPVRLVKLIGDEAMLVCEDPGALVAAMLELRESAEAEREFPGLHLGASFGDVVARAGDVYGPPVNEASRLTGASAGGQFLVSPAVAASLTDAFETRELEPLDLKGVGTTTPIEVTRKRS